MPFLRFHSVNRDKLMLVSAQITDRIHLAVGCPREHIVLEVIHSDYIVNDEIRPGWPFVEVAWFDRPQEVQAEVARIVYECLKEVGYDDSDVHFESLRPENYYENGKKI